VRLSNFEHALDCIRESLQTAEFVAIDLELTGITVGGEPDSYADLASERLERACRIVESFAPIQLGITICSTSRTLTSYSIMVAPESTFLCDVSALKFVRDHNVDLNIWVDEGVRYMSQEEALQPACLEACVEDVLEPMRHLHSMSQRTTFLCQAPSLRLERQSGLDLNAWVQAQREEVCQADVLRFSSGLQASTPGQSMEMARRKVGLPRLWRLLKDARRPLVVHGFLDVLFLLACFQQRVLPRDAEKLAALVQECFPSGVYDTAFLHESIHDLRLCPLGLHRFLQSAKEHHLRKFGSELCFTLEGFTAERYGDVLCSDSEELTHEAGYDSLLTAVLFCHLQEAYGAGVQQGMHHFYLHKSTDCINLKTAIQKKGVSTKVYDSEKLVVAELLDQDARENTTKRISEARRVDKEVAFFYRKMDEDLLLIPDCTEAQLVQLSSKVPGVRWISFYAWQKRVRSERERPTSLCGRFVGSIKKFYPQQGYGFIACPDLFRIYGHDVFLHQLQAAGFQEGQHVSFSVVCNDKGQPQARALEECLFTGIIRTFDAHTGYGFISCPRTFRMYSSDVHFSCGDTDNCQVGEHVSFSLLLIRGQPWVRKVRCSVSKVPPEGWCRRVHNLPEELRRGLHHCGECGITTSVGEVDDSNGLWYCRACWVSFFAEAASATRSSYSRGQSLLVPEGSVAASLFKEVYRQVYVTEV